MAARTLRPQMPVEMVTIEAVPLARTGTYQLSTGEATFTEADLHAAAQASVRDAAVKPPRVKIDGLAASFDPSAHGGEPALGRVENMRVVAGGQMLVGDMVIPKWLAESIDFAYPSRSIEGEIGFRSATGQKHELVITAVALLGVDLPGISTLEDLGDLLGENGPAPEGHAVLAKMPARSNPFRAGLDIDLVRRKFYDQLTSGQLDLPADDQDDVSDPYDLWVCGVKLDDQGKPYLKVIDEDDGDLFRVDVNVNGNDVTFGDFVEVQEVDVPINASDARVRPPLAVWASRAESRPTPTTQETEDVDISAIREAAGLTPEQLPDDATPEQVAAALREAPAPTGETPPAGDEQPPAAVGDPQPDEGQPSEGQPQQVAAARQLPAGVVAIDEEELNSLRAGAQTAQQLAEERDRADRDRVLAAAMGEGRFAPARRDHYERMWASDPDGTRTLLTESPDKGGLAPNSVPIKARGTEPSEEHLNDNNLGTGLFPQLEQQEA